MKKYIINIIRWIALGIIFIPAAILALPYAVHFVAVKLSKGITEV